MAPIATEHALAWHLQNNFFPPVTARMIPFCRAAIRAATEGKWDEEIVVAGERGTLRTTAGKLVDDLRLEDLV